MSIVVREDLLLQVIEEVCKSLLDLNAEKSFKMIRGKFVAVVFVEEERPEGKEVGIFVTGTLVSDNVQHDDPIVVHDPNRGMLVRVFDLLSKLKYCEQAYILGDLLALEEVLTK